MRTIGTWLGAVAISLMFATSDAFAQFTTFEEQSSETKWGASFFSGGDVDSLGNVLLGFRVNYKLLEVDPLARLSPEGGLEVRKNYVLLKIGARGDSREFMRFSAFGGAGVLRIQDFTNSGDSDFGSDESWYVNFGAKFRLPSLQGTPVLGGILGGIPLENVSLFVAEELTGLENPTSDEGAPEFGVNEWYPYSIQIGVMVGSASGWHTE